MENRLPLPSPKHFKTKPESNSYYPSWANLWMRRLSRKGKLIPMLRGELSWDFFRGHIGQDHKPKESSWRRRTCSHALLPSTLYKAPIISSKVSRLGNQILLSSLSQCQHLRFKGIPKGKCKERKINCIPVKKRNSPILLQALIYPFGLWSLSPVGVQTLWLWCLKLSWHLGQ